MPDFRVVILSANASNVAACVGAILKNEPELPRNRIIVVDDGAHAGLAYSALKARDFIIDEVTWLEGTKPFVFARNANIGLMTPIDGQYQDAVLLNDDAELMTPQGFSLLSRTAAEHPEYGIISAAITDAIGNLRQKPQGLGLRAEPGTVCFVAVYIPLGTLRKVGPLDERFIDYGFDDDDYCQRTRLAGLKVGIYDGCIVRHGRLPSSYRSGGHCSLEPNRQIFNRKWGTCA